MDYLATHFTHFNALRFARALNEAGLSAGLMPVPRKVSSSCGTCVRFHAEDYRPFLFLEPEHIFRILTDPSGQPRYELVYESGD